MWGNIVVLENIFICSIIMIVEACLIIVALCFYFYHCVTKQFDFFKKRGIPFLPPSFPFGSSCAKEMIMGKVSFLKMEEAAVKELPNEKVFGYFMFGQPTFVINDAEIAKRVLIKDFEYFTDLRIFETNDQIGDLFMVNLAADEWKKMR